MCKNKIYCNAIVNVMCENVAWPQAVAQFAQIAHLQKSIRNRKTVQSHGICATFGHVQ